MYLMRFCYKLRRRIKDYERRIQVYSQDGVMNPARILKCMPPDTTYKEFMQMSITMLKMCDQIYMLKGWEKSCGANQEYGYALACDMIIERGVSVEGPFNDREYMLLRSAIAREQEACSTVEEEGELTAILKDIEDKIYYMQHPDEKVAVCAIQGFATDCSLAIAEEIVNIQKNSEIAEDARTGYRFGLGVARSIVRKLEEKATKRRE